MSDKETLLEILIDETQDAPRGTKADFNCLPEKERLSTNKKKYKERKNAKKKNFANLFLTKLTEIERQNIVNEFVDSVLDKKIPLDKRLKVLELVLRIIGEDGDRNLTNKQSEYMNKVIQLKIK